MSMRATVVSAEAAVVHGAEPAGWAPTLGAMGGPVHGFT